MIGDNPINDIRGGREQINAVTLQKSTPVRHWALTKMPPMLPLQSSVICAA